MPKVYSPADDEVFALAKDIRREHHKMLDKAKVTIEILFVESDSVPVLSHHGAGAYAVVRIVGPKERAKGQADAEIVIDKEAWGLMEPETQRALLDQQLHQLNTVQKDGEIQWDAQERPKLKLRKPDFQVRWFHDIVRRYSRNSIEVRQAHALTRDFGQLYFPELMINADAPPLPVRTPEPCEGDTVASEV